MFGRSSMSENRFVFLKNRFPFFVLLTVVGSEDAREVGRNIQLKLDGKVTTETLERKMKVKSLAELRKNKF